MAANGLFSLFVSALNGDYQPEGRIADADVVFALSMGYGLEDGQPAPGGSNRRLAEYIFCNCRQMPVFAQEEIALELAKLGYPGVIRSFGEIGERISSYELLSQMVAEMHDPGREYFEPVVVAAAHHVGRVVAIARRLHVEPIIPSGLPEAFDPSSAQRWTRGPILWILKELMVWPHHFWKEWI